MPTPGQLAKARLGDAAKTREMARVRMRDEAKVPFQPLQQLMQPTPRVTVRNLVKRQTGSEGRPDSGRTDAPAAASNAVGNGAPEPPSVANPNEAVQPKLRVRLANELREWQCALTLRADHALEGSMKTRALLRECEHMLYEDEQATRRADRSEHEAALASSSDDPVKQRRLQRCDELQRVLVGGRQGLEAHSARLDAAAQANERIHLSLGELTFTDAEIAAEIAAQAEEEPSEVVAGRAVLAKTNADTAARRRAERRAARDTRASSFLEGVDWTRLER
mmetsp:Transcript_29517/g.95213  ORF Transcript_29517/g.95213 Transcript_29517/m.95213 type:complete len:279 (-) Transcript_29517:279-1115(-)|eukprot:scaffold33447_cov129-Isochrysis_galbana.AAC.2